MLLIPITSPAVSTVSPQDLVRGFTPPPYKSLTYNYLYFTFTPYTSLGGGNLKQKTHLVWKLCKTNLAS